MKRLLTFIFTLCILVTVFSVKVDASSYNYNFYSNPVYSSEGLSYKDTMYYDYMFEDSPYLENYPDNPYFLKRDVKNFTSLADISIDNESGLIYLIDSAEDESKTYKIKVKVTDGEEVVDNYVL